MAFASWEDRQSTLKWLQRPFLWASDIAMFVVIIGFGIWQSRDLLPPYTIVVFFALGNCAVIGLILWGIGRMTKAARR